MRAAVVPRGVSVRRLRLHGDRLHATRILESADAHPRGLSPSAILCVRSVRSRLPHHESSVWERALSESLERTARRAVRPIREPVPASADAVLFADEAELLACLARDVLRGTLADAWWWRGLGLRVTDLGGVTRVWLAAAEYIPAALTHLADLGEAVPLVSALPVEAVHAITRAVVRQFGLTGIARGVDVDEPASVASRVEARQPVVATTPVNAKASLAPTWASVSALWQALTPEATPLGLAPTRQLLLGVALTVQRAPSRARSEAFAAAVEEWLVAAVAPSTIVPPKAVASALSTEPYRREPRSVLEPVEADITHPVATDTPSRPPGRDSEVVEATTPVSVASGLSPRELARPRPTEGDATVAIAPTQARPEMEETVSIETEVGGVFFLVNMALALGWYADFTQPAAPGLGLCIWDFLRLAGKRLVGLRAHEDPLWMLLQQLGGAPLEVRDPWSRWLRRRTRFMRAELRRRLRTRDVGAVVCLHHAALDLTATHLDIRMSLKHHPIAVRLAGLDRDLGWVPAAGRFITFHFELT